MRALWGSSTAACSARLRDLRGLRSALRLLFSEKGKELLAGAPLHPSHRRGTDPCVHMHVGDRV